MQSITNINISQNRILEDLNQAFPETIFSYHAQGKSAVIFKAVDKYKTYAIRITNLQKMSPINSQEALHRFTKCGRKNVINSSTMRISRATGQSTYDVYAVGWFVSTKHRAYIFNSKSGRGGRRLSNMVKSIPNEVLENRKRVYGYMKVEWLEGEDLSDLQRSGTQLSKTMLPKLQSTLAQFWNAGFSHNDLVGANIMWIPSQHRFVIVDLDTVNVNSYIQTRKRTMQSGENAMSYLKRQKHPDAHYHETSIEPRIKILFD